MMEDEVQQPEAEVQAEEQPTSSTPADILQAALDDNVVLAQDMFRDQISDRLRDVLDQQKAAIAQNIYNDDLEFKPEEEASTEIENEGDNSEPVIEMDPELERFLAQDEVVDVAPDPA